MGDSERRASSPRSCRLAANVDEAADRPSFPRSAGGAVAVFGLIGAVLLCVGDEDYPDLHIIVDTGMCLLARVSMPHSRAPKANPKLALPLNFWRAPSG